ncbi:hypothetical protein BJF83_14375 [Nocardiopsis sp. CNR-923]|uniref:hypothetical protein n=1 Tax=Nocardiopsis sp. CNR-923 TaxID=1904965 RepID=UPI00096A1929|nr:hypothetical protein [Nocardiopsis sp. CNR-923]OLT28688.1 hypothetical protein BJF83_14375 [Nocardiopsis sp. CNR-923]
MPWDGGTPSSVSRAVRGVDRVGQDAVEMTRGRRHVRKLLGHPDAYGLPLTAALVHGGAHRLP